MFVVRKWCDQLYSYGGKINQAVFAISIFRGMELSLWVSFLKNQIAIDNYHSGSKDGRQLKV